MTPSAIRSRQRAERHRERAVSYRADLPSSRRKAAVATWQSQGPALGMIRSVESPWLPACAGMKGWLPGSL